MNRVNMPYIYLDELDLFHAITVWSLNELNSIDPCDYLWIHRSGYNSLDMLHVSGQL